MESMKLGCTRLVRRLLAMLLVGLGFWSAAALAQTCAAPGWEGAATPTGVVNTYHAGNLNVAAGATSISVTSLNGQRTNTRALRAGDLILIMQMQDSVSAGNAGLHEYAQIVSINTFFGILNLNRPLTNSYNFAMNTTNVRNWQVVYVPQYASATITGTVSADPWLINTGNGQGTGGVVAMDVAGRLTHNGTITAAGSGFRGGGGVVGIGTSLSIFFNTANYNFTPTFNDALGAVKGEGTQGTPIVVSEGLTLTNYSTLLGQGYALGAAGQAAVGNGGGGANDGDPDGSTGTNGNNAGGGGGGNAGAGGRGGNSFFANNLAGGFGGVAIANSATRLVMGGGGGAGNGNNNTGASAVTVYPPVTSTLANGATGAISMSGARGGGVVLVRSGSIAGNGIVDVNGYNAHNSGPATDGAGGGGAGGSIYFSAQNGSGSTLTLRANGGAGGRTNSGNHGPGGGGAGGYIQNNLAGVTTSVLGGANGLDDCCGAGGVAEAYTALPGSAGLVAGVVNATGVLAGAQCLPNLNVSKSTSTPLISASTGATAIYTISASNSGGAATNLYLFDEALPPGWTYLTPPGPTYTYSPAPPPAANVNSSGAETVAAVLPAGFPVNSATSANSATAVSLRANGAAPGVVPSSGANSLRFGSFYLPQGGSINLSFVVSIPDTAAVGTYHNSAGVAYLDPTRLTSAARMISPLTAVNANRTGTAISSNTTYASGNLTNVLGTNYSGLQTGGTGENVTLLADLSVTKSGPATGFAGGTGTYSLVGRNLGRAIGVQTFSTSQATDVIAANVSTVLSANPIRITDTFPSGVSLDASPAGTNWTCTGVAGNTSFSCGYFQSNPSLAYPLASNTALPTITVPVLFASNACPAVSNFATISLTPGETATANNTSNSVATTVGCNTSLSVTKTNGTATLVAGSTTQYTVTFVNSGPAGAAGAVIKDQPSAGLSSCSVTNCIPSGTGSCPAPALWPNFFAPAGLTLPSFASGATLNFIVSCGVTATGL